MCKMELFFSFLLLFVKLHFCSYLYVTGEGSPQVSAFFENFVTIKSLMDFFRPFIPSPLEGKAPESHIACPVTQMMRHFVWHRRWVEGRQAGFCVCSSANEDWCENPTSCSSKWGNVSGAVICTAWHCKSVFFIIYFFFVSFFLWKTSEKFVWERA